MELLNYKKYGKVHPLEILISNYAYGNSLGIALNTYEQGYPEPWSTLTVNFNHSFLEPNCAFIDTNNNGDEIIDWLLENQLGELTGKYERSGYCSYPEFRFDMKRLQEVGTDIRDNS